MKSAENAVIPTFPVHCPHGLQHLRHKRSTFAFTPESGYTLGSAQRIAHSGSHAETRGVSDGGAITTLGAFCAVRKPCAAGYQNGALCRFGGLVGGTPEERRKPAEQRCAYARRCSAGVAAPLGCVIFFRFCRNYGFHTLCSGLSACARHGRYHYPRRALRVAKTPDDRLSKGLICRFLRSGDYH